MIKTFNKNTLLALAALPVLSACGGGATTPAAIVDFLQTTPGETATVTVFTLDTGTSTAGSTTGTYTYATAAAAIAATDYSVDGSSVLSNDRTSTRYSYVAGLTVVDENRLILLQTDAPNLPSDTTVVYEGQGFVIVTDNGATYEGAMEATITANFGTAGDTVDVLLDELAATATKNGVIMVPADFTGSETVEFTGLVISGATFAQSAGSGSTIGGFGLATTSDTSGATLDVDGAFAGDNGTEVGGVGIIDQGGAGAEAFVIFSGTD